MLSLETAGTWTPRLHCEELHPLYDSYTIVNVLINEVRPYRVNFKLIGDFARRCPVYGRYAYNLRSQGIFLVIGNSWGEHQALSDRQL